MKPITYVPWRAREWNNSFTMDIIAHLSTLVKQNVFG
nr:MAG TPA: hypothetical protein [Caudoviricetes sp.]